MVKGEGHPKLSRGDFLRLTAIAGASLFLPTPRLSNSEVILAELTPPAPKEEIPKGVDLSLTIDEIKLAEDLWSEVENMQTVPSIQDYYCNISVLFNVTRARGLRGEAFTEMVGRYLEKGVNINGQTLRIVGEIQNLLPEVSKIRDKVLDGEAPSALYGLAMTKLSQSIMFSYLYYISETWTFGPECTGNYELAYTQFVPRSVAEVITDDIEAYSADKKDYYVGVENLTKSLPNEIFNLRTFIPQKGLVQREFKKIDDLWFGDTIFRDKSSGYKFGHPVMVLRLARDLYGNPSESPLTIFDSNVGGRMVAGVYILQDKKQFNSMFNVEENKLGILRTEFADDERFLRKTNLSNIPKVEQLPVEITAGRQEIFPDFQEFFTNLWKKFSSTSQRSGALQEIINKVGLYIRNKENGNIDLGPRWTSDFGNNYWLCNLYSTFLIMACGVKDMGHWFLNDKPAQNEGKEYDVAEMFKWLNSFGRENNWIDVTHASVEVRKKLLSLGYVLYGATKGHTWTILPIKNPEGKIVPTLSQHGYAYREDFPNYSYKFLRPRSCVSFYPNEDPPQYNLGKTDGILWAHLLPNVDEIKNPYRAFMFGHNLPEIVDIRSNCEDTGWLTSIADIKKYIGEEELNGVTNFFESLLNIKEEKLPTGNHIFNYAFNLVKLIQRYQLPLGVPSAKDADIFVEYLKLGLTKLGYKKLVNGSYADAIFNNIRYGFVTREESYKAGRPFQPIRGFGLVQLLDLGRGYVDYSPVRAGGLSTGNAQNIAEKLLSMPRYLNLESALGNDKVIHFENNYPTGFERFKAGDTFYVAYGPNSEGHTGVILTDPFLNQNGELVVAVADSNRNIKAEGEGIEIQTDGMPRIRIMTFELFNLNYLVGKDFRPNAQMALLRSGGK